MLTDKKVRPSTHTNTSTTHAIEREHLACLLCVRSNNLVVLLINNNSLNAIKKELRIPQSIRKDNDYLPISKPTITTAPFIRRYDQ